jgi:hypothetical protein
MTIQPVQACMEFCQYSLSPLQRFPNKLSRKAFGTVREGLLRLIVYLYEHPVDFHGHRGPASGER